MGCVASRSEKEERVTVCKERKVLMKQLLRYREEFANAQLAYLRSLKNTGVTLRQFTESESLELEDPTPVQALPPSPPTPLPPSPPPPPAFSPDLRKFEDNEPKAQVAQGEIEEVNENDSHIPPPPPVPNSPWDYWDPFDSSPLECLKKVETVEQVEYENWEEANSEFVEEDDEAAVAPGKVVKLPRKQQMVELVDDTSSMTSWHSKDTADKAMVIWQNKRTLTAIVKELDDYFVKASGEVKKIAVFIDISMGDTFLFRSIKDSKRIRSSSAKVFSSLTWSWSSKSFRSTKDVGFYVSGEPCKPGAHCITLQKLYSEEQKLYKEVKEEENAKMELQRKAVLLYKQEEDHDLVKSEKIRSAIDNLQSHICSLQQSIRQSYSTIIKLIHEELQPQLIALATGLMHLWQTMYDCHQVQNHISQQLNHLANQQNTEFSSEYHQQAAAQLKTEVTSWYSSFGKLVKYQQEYVRALCKWTELTSCLKDVDGCANSSIVHAHALAEEWLLALENLPDKMVSEAIKGLLSAVHEIILQQHKEVSLRKGSDKLVRKLERELTSLSEVEMKFEGGLSTEDANSSSTSKTPLSIRRAKVEALKRVVDDQKAKYIKSVQTTRTMILNNLSTSLPNIFQALMVYSNAYAQSFEVILNSASIVGHDHMQPAT